MIVTPAVLLLTQVKVLVNSIRAAFERPVDKIDKQQLRKHAHQLADYCKDGESAGLLWMSCSRTMCIVAPALCDRRCGHNDYGVCSP
jgi:hypothetical protein